MSLRKYIDEIRSELLAITVTLACLIVTAKYLSEEVSYFFAILLGLIDNDTHLLLVDLVVSFAIYLSAGAVAHVVTVNRHVETAFYVSVAFLLFTFAERWLLNDYDWPVWYELSLLVGIVLGVNGGAAVAAGLGGRRGRSGPG